MVELKTISLLVVLVLLCCLCSIRGALQLLHVLVLLFSLLFVWCFVATKISCYRQSSSFIRTYEVLLQILLTSWIFMLLFKHGRKKLRRSNSTTFSIDGATRMEHLVSQEFPPHDVWDTLKIIRESL